MASTSDTCKCQNDKTNSTANCLGRCEMAKHHCLDKEDVKVRVPKNMGWLYTARDSPDHQLRCGWRPGHISNPVLKAIQRNRCLKYCGRCRSCCKPGCYSPFDYPCCGKPCKQRCDSCCETPPPKCYRAYCFEQ